MSPAPIEDDGHLASELETLPAETRDLLARHHFDARLFLSLASRVRRGALADNRVEGEVSPPAEEDLASLPARGTLERARLEGIGAEALRKGRVALVVLAGGMATRMGGVVKALVEVLPGRTFLDVRVAEQAAVERRTGARPPVWLMTSHATDVAIRNALAGRPDAHGMRTRGANGPEQRAEPALVAGSVRTFPQRLSLRLTSEGGLFRDATGHPSVYAPGHGDVLDALRDSGFLSDFVREDGGTVVVTNLDNLGATLDEAIVGFHLSSGASITSEVVDRYDADRGGLVVRHRGRQTVLEELRLPLAFDVRLAPVFNINTFYFDAAALLDLHPDWTYFAVKKKVDGAEVIQFERILNEIVDWLPTRFLRVARSGEEARFLPVKDHAELLAHRGTIEAVLRARGILA